MYAKLKQQFYNQNKSLAGLVNISADDALKYFSYFSQKTGFDISYEDNLHEMSTRIFWEK